MKFDCIFYDFYLLLVPCGFVVDMILVMIDFWAMFWAMGDLHLIYI